MKNIIIRPFIFLCLLYVFQCSENPVKVNRNLLFHISFENEEDADTWPLIVNNAPPGGGEKSFHIGGGCVQPAFSYEVQELPDKGVYKLSCWGKMGHGQSPGTIKLAITEGENKDACLNIHIIDAEWTYYETEEYMYCGRNSKLKLNFYIGGFVYNSMYIDEIKVEKVDSIF